MLAFLETVDAEDSDKALPLFEEKTHVLLFFKYYNPVFRVMSYCGHLYVPTNAIPSKKFF